MTGKGRASGLASSMPMGLAAGALAEILLTVAMSVLGAKLIDAGLFQENAIGYFAMTILLVSSFVGAAISVSKIKRRRLLVCALSGILYFGILLGMTALFFGGQYSGVGVTAVMVLCGAGLVVFTGSGGERKGQNRRSRAVHR